MAGSGGPVAGTLRRPSWRDPRLLAGLVLIAASVAAVLAIVDNADATTPYYAAREPLAPGHTLRESDLVVVHVRVHRGTYLDAEEVPWGRVVSRPIGAGELVPAAALVSPEEFTARTIAVDTALPLADGIGVGSAVDLWVTVQTDGAPQSQLVGEGLTVTSIDTNSRAFGSSAGQTVYVSVPGTDVANVLDALAADGTVAIVGAS